MKNNKRLTTQQLTERGDYITTCKNCKQKNTLVVEGTAYFFKAPLTPDGFAVAEGDITETNMELVTCINCNNTTPLNYYLYK